MVTVVIPFMNEKDTLATLHERIVAVLEARGVAFEILFVDDGSTDTSLEVANAIAESDPRVGIIQFRRNFGKAAALDAGFRRAKGDVVITMDADLQDDPAEIPRFLDTIDAGADVVSGWKQKRYDPWHKTAPSKLFNATVRRVSGLKLHDFNCGFKAYRRELLEGVTLYGEMHRFIPVLLAARGARVEELVVQHHARQFGVSKYGVKRLAKGFFDLLTVLLNTRYYARPLHLFGLFGGLMGLAGVLILMYLTVQWFLGHGPIGTRPLLFLGLLLVMVGVQIVSTGLIAEVVTRSQTNAAEHYVIRSYREPGSSERSRSPDAGVRASSLRLQ